MNKWTKYQKFAIPTLVTMVILTQDLWMPSEILNTPSLTLNLQIDELIYHWKTFTRHKVDNWTVLHHTRGVLCVLLFTVSHQFKWQDVSMETALIFRFNVQCNHVMQFINKNHNIIPKLTFCVFHISGSMIREKEI